MLSCVGTYFKGLYLKCLQAGFGSSYVKNSRHHVRRVSHFLYYCQLSTWPWGSAPFSVSLSTYETVTEITVLFSSVISFSNVDTSKVPIIMVFNAPETIHPESKDITLDRKGHDKPVIVIHYLNMSVAYYGIDFHISHVYLWLKNVFSHGN